MMRFVEIRKQRLAQFAIDIQSAEREIEAARKRVRHEAYERKNALMNNDGTGREPSRADLEIEAEAARQLAAEEEAIARRHDMPPGWTLEENERAWGERRGGP